MSRPSRLLTVLRHDTETFIKATSGSVVIASKSPTLTYTTVISASTGAVAVTGTNPTVNE